MIGVTSIDGNKSRAAAPLVSICVITYNHEKYIRQCLDGIFMQIVDFPFEVLVHDDASPDRTADIIREYEAKYPGILKPIYQTENQYSQKILVNRFNTERARGKYIAFCEGDDYWTDSNKLQMQVDFLEQHPEYAGTAHNVRVVDENGNDVPGRGYPWEPYPEHIFSKNDIELCQLPGQSASLISKNIFASMDGKTKEEYYALPVIGDQKRAMLVTLYGNIYCFNNIMSVYRYCLTGNSWSARNRNLNDKGILCSSIVHMSAFAETYYHITLDYGEYFFSETSLSVLICLRHPNLENWKVVKQIFGLIADNPEHLRAFMRKFICRPQVVVQRVYDCVIPVI